MFGDKKRLVVSKSGIRLIPKTKRESFLPSDEEWLDSNSKVQFGKKELGYGLIGTVYELDDNSNLVIKIPNQFIPPHIYKSLNKNVDIHTRTEFSRQFIQREADHYNERYKDSKLFAPTKIVSLGIKTPSGKDYIGLIRPKLITTDSALRKLTDKQLFELRDMIIEMSESGYVIRDHLQLGIDRIGRVQIYDMGDESIGRSYNKKYVYDNNNRKWCEFLKCIEKSGIEYGYIRF